MVNSPTGERERDILTTVTTPQTPDRTTVKSVAKSALVSALDSRALLSLTAIADSLAVRAGSRVRHTGQASGHHVLINSTGGGNIGDQAMFESFLANVDGPVKAIVRDVDAFDVPDSLAPGRVELVVLPRLVYGRGLSRFLDVLAFARTLRGARSLSIVGADVMDGGYGRRPSALEWSLGTAAAKAEIPTRVLGFSWKENVDLAIVNAARRAARGGVVAIARDPHSRGRLSRNDIPADEAADVVFLHAGVPQPNAHEELVRGWVQAGKRVAVVNMSGLINSTFNQNEEYGQVVDTLDELGYEILLLPHVSTDIPTIESFKASDPSRRDINHVDRLLAPSDVKAIAAQADVVVTGRMHLSILALSSGVPSIVLATQGKVLGLMELVGTPESCIDPVKGFAAKVIGRLRDLELNRAESAATIGSGVERARVLAAVNFRDL
jgi:colanic acid/amylovoran biosynthesis protein